jgi:Fe-S cluster assembly protein SufD
MTAAVAAPLDYPSTRDEAWRYTPVDAIVTLMTAGTSADGAAPRPAITRVDVDRLAGDHGGPRLVFVNGCYEPQLSADDGSPPGVSCQVIHGPERQGAPVAGDVTDGFLARNRAEARDAAVIVVATGASVDEPLHLVHVSAAPGTASAPSVAHPRASIEVGDRSSVTIIETYCTLGDGPAVTNASTTVRIGAGATVDHYRIEDEGGATAHVGHTGIHQEAGSELRVTAVTVGGDIARNAIAVQLAGPGARIDLAGLNVTGGRQRHDTVVTVDHTAPRCTSRQRVRGVVDDRGKGSFSGEIIVQPGADGSDADQSNRNLVLSADAEADTRPWLRILTDDVACTHGATIGRLDDDALFYLRSRGVPLPRARAMLVEAFVDDITDAITPPTLRQHVGALVRRRHAAAADRKEAS